MTWRATWNPFLKARATITARAPIHPTCCEILSWQYKQSMMHLWAVGPATTNDREQRNTVATCSFNWDRRRPNITNYDQPWCIYRFFPYIPSPLDSFLPIYRVYNYHGQLPMYSVDISETRKVLRRFLRAWGRTAEGRTIRVSGWDYSHILRGLSFLYGEYRIVAILIRNRCPVYKFGGSQSVL